MRFSLLGLFGIVTACGVACAAAIWLGRLAEDPRDNLRNASIGAVQLRGVGHSVLIGQSSRLTPEALQVLRTLDPPVHELVVTDRKWSHELAVWIAALPNIRSLKFTNCEGFDDGFEAILHEHDGILQLELCGCDLSTISLPRDSPLHTLVLDRSNVTDEQMEPVVTYRHLVRFSANETVLTESGLSALLPLRRLQKVSLIDTPASVGLIEKLLESDSVVLIELSELQFAYDAFAKHPRSRSAQGGSRVNIHNKNWLKPR